MYRGASWRAFGLVALLGACSAEPGANVVTQAIVNGEASGADQNGVLLLRAQLEDDREVVCTATLVAPNLVLTAQHCVSYISSGLFSCTTRGELTDNPDGGGQLGLSLPPDTLELYDGLIPRQAPIARGQSIVSTHSTNICQNDIALVVLDTPLDLPVAPLRLGRPVEVGERGVLVGYGLNAGQRVIDYRTQPRQQKRDLDVRGVGPDSLEEGVTTVAPRTLQLEGPSGCIGDSGGPLLSQRTGAVLGVYSLQSSIACDSPRTSHQLVHVPAFRLLIEDAFEAAGATPVAEREEPAPSGAAGGAGEGGAALAPPLDGGAPPTPEIAKASSSCGYAFPPSRHHAWVVAAVALAALGRRRR